MRQQKHHESESLRASWHTAVALLLLACVVIAGMGALAKALADTLPPVQIAFLRFALALPLLVGLSASAPWRLLAPSQIGLHLLRGAAAGSALAMAFFAFAHLRLGDATALLFLEPVFVVALAALVQRRPLESRQWLAVGTGLVGAYVILQPGVGTVSIAGAVAVGSAAAAATVALLTRRLATARAAPVLLFQGALMPTVVLALPATWVWISPTWGAWSGLALLALAGTIGQRLIIAAYRRAPPSLLAPVEYAQLPMALGLGFFLFGEPITAVSVVGIGIITAAPLVGRRNAKVGVASTSRKVEQINY